MTSISRFFVALALAGALSAVALYASAGPEEETAGSRATAAATDAQPSFTYVGTKKCRMCHTLQYESWRKSPKGGSWEALKPGVAAEVKARAGLDLRKDYTQDETCLRCHSVGFGQAGGYAIFDPADAKAARAARAREGAGCESCHGPGSGFVRVMAELHRTEREPDPKELSAAGRHVVTQQVCNQCHHDGAVCMLVRGTGGGVKAAKDLRVDVNDRRGYHEKARVLRRPLSGKDASEDDE